MFRQLSDGLPSLIAHAKILETIAILSPGKDICMAAEWVSSLLALILWLRLILLSSELKSRVAGDLLRSSLSMGTLRSSSKSSTNATYPVLQPCPSTAPVWPVQCIESSLLDLYYLCLSDRPRSGSLFASITATDSAQRSGSAHPSFACTPRYPTRASRIPPSFSAQWHHPLNPTLPRSHRPPPGLSAWQG